MIEYSNFLLIVTVLALGFRHGFDLDHIATIDAMTRTVKMNHRLAKWVGFLFSLGHGLVVIFVSVIIGTGIFQATLPSWLEGLGQWISVFFLLTFGLMTLWGLLPGKDNQTLPHGPKSLLIRHLSGCHLSPSFVILVGSLFALSFDTISQVALFSLSASKTSGWLFSMMIGVVFMLGMMASDGLNGLLVAKLVEQAGNRSLVISKIIGIIIAGFSLTLGVLGFFQVIKAV